MKFLKKIFKLLVISMIPISLSSCGLFDYYEIDTSEDTEEKESVPSEPEWEPEEEPAKDSRTILIYMCGADLESGTDEYGSTHPNDAGLATEDISEILSVPNQPEDVNIIIETGGAKAWKSTYGISSDKLERWEVRNQQLKKIQSFSYSNMGKQSTFQSFLSWGLNTYPAEKVGVIFWNHGGALDGVCFDEKSTGQVDDSLLNSEVDAALTAVLGTRKLEWVGYDACLMAVQDIAEFNSKHFNYMVSAQEAEIGKGWAYHEWIDDLYLKKDTTELLTEICDTFISSVDDYLVEEGYEASENDQTLSYLDLSKMSEYKSSFDSLTTKVKSVGKTKVRNLMKTVKNYADMPVEYDDYYYYVEYLGYDSDWFTYSSGYYILKGYYLYGTFDLMDMFNKMKSNNNFSACSTELDNVLSAINNLVAYKKCGQSAGNSNGLCVVVDIDGDNLVTESYLTSETNFTSWRSFIVG